MSNEIRTFVLGGISEKQAGNMVGETWENLPQQIKDDILWAGQTGDGDGYNPGALSAITDLLQELYTGVSEDRISLKEAQYFWKKTISILQEHNVYGPNLWILYKDYSNQSPIAFMFNILETSDEFMLAKQGIRKG